MQIKQFVGGILFCKIVASIIAALSCTYHDPIVNFWQFFIALLLLGTSKGILVQIGLYTISFFIIKYTALQKLQKNIFYFLVSIETLGILFFTILSNWIISKKDYINFVDFFLRGGYYAYYILSVVMVVTIFGLRYYSKRFVVER